MASWIYSKIWGSNPDQPMRPQDAAHSPALRQHFRTMLDNTEPPEVFKPSDVCMLLKPKELAALGYADWRDGIPAVRELAFDMRGLGYCEILQKGVILGDDVDLMDIQGPIRIRRKHTSQENDLASDDW